MKHPSSPSSSPSSSPHSPHSSLSPLSPHSHSALQAQGAPAAAETDRRLRRLVHEQMPQGPQDPLFTRKVVNRLPPRRSLAVRLVPAACYVAAALLAGGLWVMLGAPLLEGRAGFSSLLWFLALLLATGVSVAVPLMSREQD